MKKIAILMATYNGAAYVGKQIESIMAQSYSAWDLFVNDDNSTDGTRSIIHEFSKRDDRVHILNLNNGSHGQLNNFRQLLLYIRQGSFDYIMFSDQDDVWYKNKILSSLKQMVRCEQGPTLVYTNYCENASNGELYNKYDKGIFKRHEAQLFVQNWTMGCTMMLNRELVIMTGDIPLEAENHDNWIMLVALTFGKIFYLDEVTMFHRIHDNNVTTSSKKKSFSFRIKRLFQDYQHRNNFRENEKTLMESLMRLKGDFQNNLVNEFLNALQSRRKLRRISRLVKNGFFGLNFHKTIRLWLLV